MLLPWLDRLLGKTIRIDNDTSLLRDKESQDDQTVKERFHHMVTNEECPDDTPGVFEEARQALKHAEAELAQARELEARAEADLRKAEKELEEASRACYVFFVGKERFETHRRELTGAEIKAMVPNWPAGYALELEGWGDEPDRIIGDHEIVKLHKDRALHFISVPPATFGAS